MGFHEVNGYWSCDKCQKTKWGVGKEPPHRWVRFSLCHPSVNSRNGKAEILPDKFTHVYKEGDCLLGAIKTRTSSLLCLKCARKVAKRLPNSLF